MKKTNESMLDVISYGGYSNQLTADYYPNNQVYNQLISELLKCKSGALLAYDDNNMVTSKNPYEKEEKSDIIMI